MHRNLLAWPQTVKTHTMNNHPELKQIAHTVDSWPDLKQSTHIQQGCQLLTSNSTHIQWKGGVLWNKKCTFLFLGEPAYVNHDLKQYAVEHVLMNPTDLSRYLKQGSFKKAVFCWWINYMVSWTNWINIHKYSNRRMDRDESSVSSVTIFPTSEVVEGSRRARVLQVMLRSIGTVVARGTDFVAV